VTGSVTLITDVLRIDGCAKLQDFSAVLHGYLCYSVTSLLSLILVCTLLNNFYFRSFSLLKFLYCLVFTFL